MSVRTLAIKSKVTDFTITNIQTFHCIYVYIFRTNLNPKWSPSHLKHAFCELYDFSNNEKSIIAIENGRSHFETLYFPTTISFIAHMWFQTEHKTLQKVNYLSLLVHESHSGSMFCFPVIDKWMPSSGEWIERERGSKCAKFFFGFDGNEFTSGNFQFRNAIAKRNRCLCIQITTNNL